MDLSPKIESAHNALRPQGSSLFAEVMKIDNEWHHVAARRPSTGSSIEFKLHDETTRLGYYTEVTCQGSGVRRHAFGTSTVYVAESDGDDELISPLHVAMWRHAKPFPKERFLGVCDSNEEEHLGQVSPMFVTYLFLRLSELQANGSAATALRFHQTRHYMDAEGKDYWETLIDVVHPTRRLHIVTMRESEGDRHVVFVGPNIADRMFGFKDLAEAANYILNTVF